MGSNPSLYLFDNALASFLEFEPALIVIRFFKGGFSNTRNQSFQFDITWQGLHLITEPSINTSIFSDVVYETYLCRVLSGLCHSVLLFLSTRFPLGLCLDSVSKKYNHASCCISNPTKGKTPADTQRETNDADVSFSR